MDLVSTLRKTAQIARERDQLTALPEGMERAADRIAELEAALRKINALIDSPARFNPEVQAVLDSVIDTSDTKFANQK